MQIIEALQQLHMKQFYEHLFSALLELSCDLHTVKIPKWHRSPSWTEVYLDVTTVRWLLRKCGRVEIESRRKCIEPVCTFISLLPGTLSKEKKRKFKANLVHQTCLTDMSKQFSIPMVYQWLDIVIASLDCYTLAFSKEFLNPLLFQDNNQYSRLIVALSYIITKISMSTLYDIVTYLPPSSQSYVFTPTYISQFETAKCTVIVRLLNFITALSSKYPQDTMRAIDSSFYNNDLTKLILTCVFNPT
ncbi:unnamed protein product [Rotaria sordida]|uniref:DNA-dependent protein kinase catalytic subunit CC1/2 domain-containing protein n=1 Tax=Rotaria sordida TaxID=392033 RepID=A0A819UWZ6_9BILA|nr:unnamed protein product [Rotaria sordida]